MSGFLRLYCKNDELAKFDHLYASIKSKPDNGIIFDCNIIIGRLGLIKFYDYFLLKKIVNNWAIMSSHRSIKIIEHMFNNISPGDFVDLVIKLNKTQVCLSKDYPELGDFLVSKIDIFYRTLPRNKLAAMFAGSELPIMPFLRAAMRAKRTDINCNDWKNILKFAKK